MDLSKIFSLRQKFTIIALTGRAGSGCTRIADTLVEGFSDNVTIFPHPKEFGYSHNSFRKYRIVYKYAAINFKPFKAIYYKDILVAFILKYSFEEFLGFLNSDLVKQEFHLSKLTTRPDFTDEIKLLYDEQDSFNQLHRIAESIINIDAKSEKDLILLFDFFESELFKSFSGRLNSILMQSSLIKRNKTLQVLANNLRRYGHPYKCEEPKLSNVFVIAELINDIIKSIKNQNGEKNTEIVIDSLRNQSEIMFFRQRFSAFYTVAINRTEVKRMRELNKRINQNDRKDLEILLKEEYTGGINSDFHVQNVSTCIQNADIHITYRTKAETLRANNIRSIKNENTSPYFSWGMQLIKFLALIDHPGIVTPSPEERCMQIASTAKYNSGCISRQVGATITDQNYSVKAIGWNNTPEGHVPCIMRNVNDLMNNEEDVLAFTPYEKNNEEFLNAVSANYKDQIIKSESDLNGLNVSFCFKSLINSYSQGKNQVHTRSLHAEESAFLQLAKYGGPGIQGGLLFTTASPCELCSKKAYQLGIKVIYYIDPYPGISEKQILFAGSRSRNPKIRLFNGAIGNAYHWLYEPVMPYKDELALILDNDIIDLTLKYKNKISELEGENFQLKNEIEQLKNK